MNIPIERAAEIVREQRNEETMFDLFEMFYSLLSPVKKNSWKDMTPEELDKDAKFGYMFANLCGFACVLNVEVIEDEDN